MFIEVPGMSTRVDASPPDPDHPRHMPDDGYPDVIADQRHAYKCDTRREVEDYWLTELEAKGLEPRFDDTLTAVPYINRARWLADCPECHVGNYAWDRNLYVCCLDCGLVYKATWLAPTIRSAAVRILAVRPIVNCNWNAHKGETLEDLEAENRWLLNDPGIEKNGLWVPGSMNMPDNLAVA